MSQMYCIKCQSNENKVTQTRTTEAVNWIYRRRVCNDCGHRWNTFEMNEDDIVGYENEYH